MNYVIDTGFFVLCRDYYHAVFPSFWKALDGLVNQGILSSVDEVRTEIKRFGGEQRFLLDWVDRNRAIFTATTDAEGYYVRKILSIPKALIGKEQTLKGGPFADPYVIAKAITLGGTVVTREKPARRDSHNNIQGALKVPDVCLKLGIPCISPEQFLKDVRIRI